MLPEIPNHFSGKRKKEKHVVSYHSSPQAKISQQCL